MSGGKLASGLFVTPLILIILVVVNLGNSGNSAAEAADFNGINENVPEPYRDMVLKGASYCQELTPALLAAQIAVESGWDPTVVSPAGAQGISQFMPGTWAGNGIDGDGDGKADAFNPADAIPSMGKFMCTLISRAHQRIEEGVVNGNPIDLVLAMYNAGEGNVLKYGGIPPFTETLNYVRRIKENANNYSGNHDGQTLPVSSNAILNEARKYLGTPYVWGGKNSSGLDCSGLVTITLTALGYPAIHGTDAQIPSYGKHVYTGLGYSAPWDKMKPGDLIGIDYTGQKTVWEYEHIGIYIGNKQMIHAPRTGTKVRVENLEWAYKDRWTIKRLTE